MAHKNLYMPLLLSGLLALPGLLVAQGVGDAWQWALPPRDFGQLSQAERLAYGRAEKLLRDGNHAAAAIEFEKFISQNPRSPVRGHALLLQGYSLHEGKKRNQALQIYTELLDFYAEQPAHAVPAAFLKGRALIENGNVDSGIYTLRELVDNQDYLEHPLADVALNQLAQHYMRAEKVKEAERCWRQVIESFNMAFIRPEEAAIAAREQLTDLYIRQGRYSTLDDLWEDPGPGGDEMTVVNKATVIYDRAMALLGSLEKGERSAFLKWFKRQRDVFIADNEEGNYLNRGLGLTFRMADTDEWKAFIGRARAHARQQPNAGAIAACADITRRMAEAQRGKWKLGDEWQALSQLVTETGDAANLQHQVQLYKGVLIHLNFPIRGTPAAEFGDTVLSRLVDVYKTFMNPARDEGYAWLTDHLKNRKEIERASEMIARIENAPLAKWKEVELFGFQEKWAEMAKACEELEEIDSGRLAARALETRAGLYRERLARYDDAIKLYRIISDPPRTVWAIVECYEKWKKPQDAVNSCSEIENFFASDAPRAGFRKAQVWDRFKVADKAIAECRAVLKKYPRHQVSSQAHQMLERYGIKTGGGVMEIDE